MLARLCACCEAGALSPCSCLHDVTAGYAWRLVQVPKMLGEVTRSWTPRAYVVSFKLETNQNILLAKVCSTGPQGTCAP
jgi:hypothetical protein